MDICGQRSVTLLSEGTMAEVMETISKSDMDCIFKQENDLPFLDTSSSCALGNQRTSLREICAVLPDSSDQLYDEEKITIPSATCLVPSKQDYEGPFKFCVELERSTSEGNKWIYSPSLNKIYVTMHSKVPVKFKWNYEEVGLYVRALPIFLEENSFEEPVVRCFGHRSKAEKSNEGFLHVDHVIRCDNKKTIFETDEESKRLSVLVPLEFPQPGSDWSTIIYTFVCKNSCIQGMNRRATAVIFTLENKNGLVLGRKMIKTRICSCPKRDMAKEEKDALKEEEKERQQQMCVREPVRGKRIQMPERKSLKRPHSQDIVDFQIKLPKMFVKNVAKYIQSVIGLMEEERTLTDGERNALRDCEKYLK